MFSSRVLDASANAVWSSGGARTTQASVLLLLAPRIWSCVFRGVGRGHRGRRFINSWRGTIVCGYCSLLHGDVIDPGGYCCLIVGWRSSFLEGMLYPDGIMRSISRNGYHSEGPPEPPKSKRAGVASLPATFPLRMNHPNLFSKAGRGKRRT